MELHHPIMSKLRDLGDQTYRQTDTKSVHFVLAYTQADIKYEIFMEVPIGFGVEGSHPREWVIRLDNHLWSKEYRPGMV